MAGVKAAPPSDFTGKQREGAQQAVAEEQAVRASELSMVTAAEVAANEEDLFDPKTGQSLGKIETVKLSSKDKEVAIRVVEDVDDMTFGAGNTYTFKVGQSYKVPLNVAKHLDRLNLVWGGLPKSVYEQ